MSRTSMPAELALFEAVASGVTVQDATSGELLYANCEAASLCGFQSVRELLRATPAELASRFEILDEHGNKLSFEDLPARRLMRGEPAPERLLQFRIEGAGSNTRYAWVAAKSLALSGRPLIVNTFRDATSVLEAQANLRKREARFEQILDSIEDMVFTKAYGSVVTYANRAATRHYGLSKDELRGITDVPFNQLDFTQQYVRDDLAVFETKRPLERPEEKNVRHDGEVRIFHTIKSPLLNEQGEVVELVGVSRDVTEQVKLRKKAADQERRLSLALTAGEMGVWEWDIAGNRVHWSEAIERMHGIAPGSFDGTFESYQSDIHPDDRDRVLRTIQDNVANRRDHNLLYRIVRPDGHVRWLEASGRMVLDANGAPERLVGVCRDVTERVEADETRTALAAEQAARRAAEDAHARIQKILEGISDAFIVYDRDFRVLFANQESGRPLGLRPEDMLGKIIWEVVPDAVGTAFHRELLRARDEQVTTTLTDYFEPLDRWYELRAYPIGELGVAAYSRDVTAAKSEEQLRARLRSYGDMRVDVSAALALGGEPTGLLKACCRSLVRHTDVSDANVWLVDPDGATLELKASTLEETPRAVLSMGSSRLGAVCSTPTASVLTDPTADELPTVAFHGAASGGVLYALPMVVNGQALGLLTVHQLGPAREDLLSALSTMAELIAHGFSRRRYELALEERAAELARSNADLEQFAYVASHDLQEPLRMVSSYVQLLARRYKGRLDADADDFIAFTVEGATRMQRLINDLLAYSRVGTRGAAFSEVPIARVVERATANLSAAIAESGAQLSHDELPTVCADESQLGQLFQNLLSNAIKFRREEPPRVHISVRRDGSHWLFGVQDNGVGISEEYFDRVFVIFQRLNTREQYPGTGIGLALAKKIVERHGGRIWLQSQLGQGTTVWFTLPVHQQRSRRRSS